MHGDTEALERQARRDVVTYLEEIRANRRAQSRLRNVTEDERTTLANELDRLDTLMDWVTGASRGQGSPGSPAQSAPGSATRRPEGRST